MLSAVGTTFEEVLRNSDGEVLKTLSSTIYMIVYDDKKIDPEKVEDERLIRRLIAAKSGEALLTREEKELPIVVLTRREYNHLTTMIKDNFKKLED